MEPFQVISRQNSVSITLKALLVAIILGMVTGLPYLLIAQSGAAFKRIFQVSPIPCEMKPEGPLTKRVW